MVRVEGQRAQEEEGDDQKMILGRSSGSDPEMDGGEGGAGGRGGDVRLLEGGHYSPALFL